MAPLKVQLRCSCGEVRAKIDAKAPIHLVCYCDDCQGYAAWLAEKQGSKTTRKVVDVQGGSRVCQVFGSEVEILAGRDKLQVTTLDPALAPKGRQELLRLHANCCMTPLFSSSWREFPTVGFYAANVVILGEDANEVRIVTPNETTGCWDDDEPFLGPPLYRINTKWAVTKPASGGAEEFPPMFLLRFILRNMIPLTRGKRNPYPYPLPAPGEAEVRKEIRPVVKNEQE